MEEIQLETQLIQHRFKDLSEEGKNQISQLIEQAKMGNFCMYITSHVDIPSHLYSEGTDEEPFPSTPFVVQKNRLYLQRNWALETQILQKTLDLRKRKIVNTNKNQFLNHLEKISSQLESAQKEAILQSFETPFSIITGGPGTGKTYTAGHFIRLLASAHTPKRPFRVAIAAPTGKAAAHLENTLLKGGDINFSCESTTLHRLLKLKPSFQNINSQTILDFDLVCVDEASMLDPFLLLHLFNSIGQTTRLLLLGDPDQLPPIEGGSFFADMATLFGNKLHLSIRMGDGDLYSFVKKMKEGFFIPNHCAQLLPTMPDLTTFLPNPISSSKPDLNSQFQLDSKCKILCALRQGPFGADSLNHQLFTHYFSQMKRDDWICLPIMITQNEPKLNLYNGTCGFLIRQQHSIDQAYFKTANGIISLSESILPKYELAFCLSIHKSQGSEYEEVLTLLPKGSEAFGKEALYTAITRAKKKVSLFAEEGVLEALLKNTSIKKSGFIDRYRKIMV